MRNIEYPMRYQHCFGRGTPDVSHSENSLDGAGRGLRCHDQLRPNNLQSTYRALNIYGLSFVRCISFHCDPGG